MTKLQTQGVHHITVLGADRQSTIDFWEGVLGMPFVFEQPNLDDPDDGHLYFDPGDGRLITVFTNENRQPGRGFPDHIGAVHHLAFSVSQSTYSQLVARMKALGIANSGEVDRGFMNSIYFRDPLGLRIELASYRFEPPQGYSHADVLMQAHRVRVAAGDNHIADPHLAQAIEDLSALRPSLSCD